MSPSKFQTQLPESKLVDLVKILTKFQTNEVFLFINCINGNTCSKHEYVRYNVRCKKMKPMLMSDFKQRIEFGQPQSSLIEL